MYYSKLHYAHKRKKRFILREFRKSMVSCGQLVDKISFNLTPTAPSTAESLNINCNDQSADVLID